MTLFSPLNKVREDGNGVKTAFDFGYKIFNSSDILVYIVTKATGVAALQTLGVNYSVSFDSDNEQGTVTYLVPPSSLQESFIARAVEIEQPTDIPHVGALQESQLENEFDRRAMIEQQLQEQIDRCLKFSPTSIFFDIILPDPVAGQVLAWNAAGDALENTALVITTTAYPGGFSFGADAAKALSPTAGDIYFAIDTRIWYESFVSGTWVKRSVSNVSFRVSQTTHGFVVGDVVRWNVTSYTKAQADSEANSEVIGMVSSVIDANAFILTLNGEVTGLAGLTAGTEYYLSPSSAGALTATRPVTPGQIRKPLLQAVSTTAGYFIPQRSLLVEQPLSQCRLTKSGANLLLSRSNGAYLTINGQKELVPSGGVTLAPTSATPNTTYFIYAYMNAGVMTLEYSATAHTTHTDGVEIKTADATRTLVGMARAITGPAWVDTDAQRFVVSYFNRRDVSGKTPQTSATLSTASATFVEMASANRIEFLTWGDEAVFSILSASINNTGVNENFIALGVDGATAENDPINDFGNQLVATITLPFWKVLSEGYHYITPLFATVAGTVTSIGAANGTLPASRRTCTHFKVRG